MLTSNFKNQNSKIQKFKSKIIHKRIKLLIILIILSILLIQISFIFYPKLFLLIIISSMFSIDYILSIKLNREEYFYILEKNDLECIFCSSHNVIHEFLKNDKIGYFKCLDCEKTLFVD